MTVKHKEYIYIIQTLHIFSMKYLLAFSNLIFFARLLMGPLGFWPSAPRLVTTPRWPPGLRTRRPRRSRPGAVADVSLKTATDWIFWATSREAPYSYGPTNSYKWEYFMIYNLSYRIYNPIYNC